MAFKVPMQAEIGVFGGSGFYTLADPLDSFWVETPYGMPSDKISVVEIAGRKVAFMPRHGHEHSFPPAQVPYRANLWAMKSLGVKHIIGPCAVGSLREETPPGAFVVCDQFVDRTSGRKGTFFEGPITTHISTADPYCPILRELAYKVGKEQGLDIRPDGTMVVIEGPRFSTKAESRWFSQMGWHVVNMTGYPECVLARELDMCYVNISLVTDYDAGLDGIAKPVEVADFMRVFKANSEKMKKLVIGLIEKWPEKFTCGCSELVARSRG